MRYATREIRLASALVEAADTLVEGFEAMRYLQRLSDHCVELLNARAAGVMLIDGGRSVSLAASSRHERMALDLLEAQHGGGPCLESYGSGRPVPPVSIRVAHAAARWPDFTERALRHDIVTTFAVPLRRREHLLGALNVFGPTLTGDTAPAADPAPELQVAQALADAAALGLQNRRAYTQYRTLSGQLQEALSSRVRIEQAKGMLAERWGVRADHAFVALRQYARRRRLALDQVASTVIEGAADDAELRREIDEDSAGPA
ncbi:GAF and ANTAR domain-containing protein [Streptomyces griseorubiginosus]|uniref:GAF and ANTAR domain-containing protein n=1 Tax=Streptomyces griseorubiginosus TaxID=67304 RepID=UPI002E7FF31C|nr:GAF and ANTAR domain-containing protein [Streptomyces griseorubiginosus]WUB46818.1 GAF and ANTAR domain-containing protein [Streptomyces griseorubiginosus]WUB55340.1 GAF and ANTAR domain-containing protein [Streptomyces griseorubiginosus]